MPKLPNLSDYVKKIWLKATQKEIKNPINNQSFLVEDPKKGEPVTPCMGIYKAKTQCDGSLDKLKLRIVVREDLHMKELVGDNWSQTASMRTLKYFLSDAPKHKERVYQLYLIGEFLREFLRICYL